MDPIIDLQCQPKLKQGHRWVLAYGGPIKVGHGDPLNQRFVARAGGLQ
jgi:hypothetical protein